MKSISARIADQFAVRVRQVDAAIALTMKLQEK